MNKFFAATTVLAMTVMGGLGVGCASAVEPSDGNITSHVAALSATGDPPQPPCPAGWKGEVPFCYRDLTARSVMLLASPAADAASTKCADGWLGEVPFCYKNLFERSAPAGNPEPSQVSGCGPNCYDLGFPRGCMCEMTPMPEEDPVLE